MLKMIVTHMNDDKCNTVDLFYQILFQFQLEILTQYMSMYVLNKCIFIK